MVIIVAIRSKVSLSLSAPDDSVVVAHQMVAAVKEGGTLTVAVGRLSRHPLLGGDGEGGRRAKRFLSFHCPTTAPQPKHSSRSVIRVGSVLLLRLRWTSSSFLP